MSSSPVATNPVVPQKRTSNVSNISYTTGDDTFSFVHTNSFSTNDTEYSIKRDHFASTGKNVQPQEVRRDNANVPHASSKAAIVLQDLDSVRSREACSPLYIDKVSNERPRVKLFNKLLSRKLSIDEAPTEADKDGDDTALALQRVALHTNTTANETEVTVQQQAPSPTHSTAPQASEIIAALSVAAKNEGVDKPSRKQRAREIGKRVGQGLVRNMADSIYGPLCPDWAIGKLKNPHSKFMMTPMSELRPDYINGNKCCGRPSNKHNHFCQTKRMELEEIRRNSPSAWSFLWDWRDEKSTKEKGKTREDSYASDEGIAAGDIDAADSGHQ